MNLDPGQLAVIVAANLERGTALICHTTLRYGDHPELGPTVCRGYYDSYGPQVRVIQIAEQLGGFEEIDPPMNHSDAQRRSSKRTR
jgi:hypothetical protein